MGYRIGVDTGGTFSDMVVFCEETGQVDVIKVPSTPKDPGLAIINGLKEALQKGFKPEEITFFSHGTTVGTNALLEGKTARVGVLLTEGFRGINDIYQVSISGADIYDIYGEMPKALVPSRFCQEIRERIDFQGNVITPLDREQARQAVLKLKEKNVQAIAVCLLFSFANSAHEDELRQIIEQIFPECKVYLSCEILPQIREYIRLSTTIVNAGIGPVLEAYLASLETRLRQMGLKTNQLYIVQSNGGVTTFSSGYKKAVTTLLSGPAAGGIAAGRLAALTGFSNAIGFDMGGTSSDISLIKGGRVAETPKNLIGIWEIGSPMLEINTIGAGGGTIARVEEGGMLKVGPQSAGADPGPVCYDKGGSEATITDANLVLGYLNPNYFLGGKQKLNRQRAESAIKKNIAEPLHLDLLEAADGIIRVVNTHMEQGIKTISTERGYDLREFVLIAFGGAGPVHAGRLAEAIGIPKVVIPRVPGAASAEGLLGSDVRHDYVRSKLELMSNIDMSQLNKELAELRAKAVSDLSQEGFSERGIELFYYLDFRYVGQGYEVTVPAPSGSLKAADLGTMRSLFDQLHAQLFGHKAETRPVEIVNYRVTSFVKTPKIEYRRYEKGKGSVDAALKEKRSVYFGGPEGSIVCPVYTRELLSPGHRIKGPAIIEQMDSTTVVYPRQSVEVDAFTNLIISIDKGKEAS